MLSLKFLRTLGEVCGQAIIQMSGFSGYQAYFENVHDPRMQQRRPGTLGMFLSSHLSIKKTPYV